MMTQKSRKNIAMAKQTRYTAKNPTTLSHPSFIKFWPIKSVQRAGISSSFDRMPGTNMNTATTDPNSSIRAYPILAAVEFLHDGHAAQHKLQAALPQQQAAGTARVPIRQPIINVKLCLL
uniref:Uncharacterized protein n=1 Tax=Arion vulgaris TaxID=1028688 RepID=A0A0B7AP68_9EUPU